MFDSFHRADSASVLGNADTGQAWTQNVGTWGISGNRGYLATFSGVDEQIATVPVGVSDMVVFATLTALMSGQAFHGVLARHTDTSNFYLVDAQVGVHRMYKRVAGTYTQLGSNVVTGANGDVFACYAQASAIKALRNGVATISVTDTALSGTRAGLRSYYINNTTGKEGFWNDFTVLGSL